MATVHTCALGEVRVCDRCLDSASTHRILMKQDFRGITKAPSSGTKWKSHWDSFFLEGTSPCREEKVQDHEAEY